MSALATPGAKVGHQQEQLAQASAAQAPELPRVDLPRNATIDDVHSAMSPGLPDHLSAMTGAA